jgi:peroxiredoxin (alkyl hydroperoxide reductase subunit C)
VRPVQRLQIGEEAPDFTLPATGGKEVSLSKYRGDKNVLLVFYPAAFTPV